MVKRTSKGRQVPRSKKNSRNQGSSNQQDNIDWNISSGEGSDEEILNMDSVSEHSDIEEDAEEMETVEEKKLRLAKEYLEKIRMEEDEKEEEGGFSDESSESDGVEERIEKRLQREAEEVVSDYSIQIGSRSCFQTNCKSIKRC